MPRKYKLKNNKLWTNHGLADAIAERDAAGTPLRKLSGKYKIPIATLHCYLNYQKEGKTIPEKRCPRSQNCFYCRGRETTHKLHNNWQESDLLLH